MKHCVRAHGDKLPSCLQCSRGFARKYGLRVQCSAQVASSTVAVDGPKRMPSYLGVNCGRIMWCEATLDEVLQLGPFTRLVRVSPRLYCGATAHLALKEHPWPPVQSRL